MRPKERGTDAQDRDRHRGRDRAEQARALGLDIPGRESDEDHSSALGSGRSHGISLISFFTCQVKNWYTLLSRKSQHFCTRIDSSKTAGAQFLRAEWKAVGSGADSHSALPLPPRRTLARPLRACLPAWASPHPAATSRVRQIRTHLCAPAGGARRPGIPALLRAPESACAVPQVQVL